MSTLSDVHGTGARTAASWRDAAGLAGGWCSAVLLIGITGALIAQGFDGLAYTLGFAGSAFLWATLVCPLMAACPQARSLPRVLADCYRSPAVGAVATGVLVVSLMGLFGAEFFITASALGLIFQSGLIGYCGALAAITVGIVWSGAFSGRAAAPVGVGLILVVSALLIAILIAFTWQDGPGGIIAIPQMGDIAALEQSLLEKRLADPATFKPHGVPFLRTDGLNFSSLIMILSLGLAVLASPRAITSDSRATPTPPKTAARAVLLLTGVLMVLAMLAAAAKRALLTLVASGLKPASLPDWMQSYLRSGALQSCGSGSTDSAALVKACGKSLGRDGLLRWQDLTIHPDALLFMSLDAATPAALVLKIAFMSAVLLAVVFTVRRIAEFAITAVADNKAVPMRVATLLITFVVTCVGVSATFTFGKPADAVTLVVWSASLAASALGPVVLAALVMREPSPTAAIIASLGGAIMTGVLLLASSSAPVELFGWLGPLSSAPAAVARKLGTLHDAWLSSADGPARDALQAQAAKLARDNLNCLGLKPLAFGMIGLALGTITLIVGSLVSWVLRSKS